MDYERKERFVKARNLLTATLCAVALPGLSVAAEQGPLALPLCINGYCAVVNQNGELVMPFDNSFGNVLAANGTSTVFVGHDKMWHLVSADGKTTLKANVTGKLIPLTPNHFGFGRGKKIGIIDGNGKVVVSPKFDDVFVGGDNEYIVYLIGKRLGLLTATGEKVTDAKFEGVSFRDSAAKRGMLVTANSHDGRNWVINLNTRQVQRVKYAALEPMADGLFVANVSSGAAYGLADRSGKLLTDRKYYRLGRPSGGLVSFTEAYDAPCGYLDYHGKLAIAPTFSTCLPFGEKEAIARELLPDGSGGKFGVIDRKGNWKGSPSYDYADDSGLSALGFPNPVKGYLTIGKKTGLLEAQYGLYSTDEGKEVVPMTYQLFGVLPPDWFVFSEMKSPKLMVEFMGNQSQVPAVGVMDKNGKRLIEPATFTSVSLDASGQFFQTLNGISKNAKASLYDLSGKQVVVPEWEMLVVDQRAGVIKGYEVVVDGSGQSTEQLLALYDLQGKPLLKVKTTACGAQQAVDGAGEVIWPKDPENYCPEQS